MFRFQLVSQTGTKFDDEVYEVVLPSVDGQIGVLSHHMPLVSVATTGPVMVRRKQLDSDGVREYYAINGGVIEVENNTLRLLVDEADHADDINQADAEAALARAKQMKAQAKDQVSLEHAQGLIDRSSVRLHVAGLKRRHQRQR